MTKPDTLYHASTNREIQLLEPREDGARFPGEGPLVFATPYKHVAAMFLPPKNGGSVEISIFDEKPVIVICSNPNSFCRLDGGGAIYELPTDTFTSDASIGMRETEWTSLLPVKPLSKTVYETSLDAMNETGVAVYFVDTKTFANIQNSGNHGFAIISSLIPFVKK